MKTTVEFEKVSKQYRLGMTRTSVPSLVAGWMRRSLTHSAPHQDVRTLWAVRDVDFDLRQGECLALVGANGAGKSTILKLLSKITRPTTGSIRTRGRIAALIELGAGFHPDLTGRENIFLNGAILGLGRADIRRRFDQIVAFAGLEGFIDTPVKRYSTGMLVRLGFAIASCIEAEILLVDEVLAVGDASFQQKCLGCIRGLIESGTSIIFVSHNINTVEAVCSSALYVRRGQVAARGAVGDVIRSYERDLHEARSRELDHVSVGEEGLTGSAVRITKVEVLAPEGGPLVGLRGHDTVQVRIGYRLDGPATPADAVIRIMRSDGLTCCMLRTATDCVPLTLNGGDHAVSVVLDPLQLISGSYFVNAYLSTVGDLVLLASGRSEWFYVSGATLSHEARSGVFEPHRRWIVQASADDRVLVG